MAKLWIVTAQAQTGGLVSGTHQSLALDFSTGAAETPVLSPNALLDVRLCADAPCFFEIGVTPVITDQSPFLPADVVDYFRIAPGNRIRVASAHRRI